MMTARSFAVCALGALFLAGGAEAQDLLVAHPLGATGVAHYRDFALKSDLATVSAAAGVASSGAKLVHQRPALLQDLEFRPSRWIAGSISSSTDPVERIVFSFYNDQLFRVGVEYASDRTEGMTVADMVEAISAVYGAPGKRIGAPVRAGSGIEDGSGSPVARWEDAGASIVLYDAWMSSSERFRLVVTDPGLDRLARKATVDAGRLDAQEGPQREIARQKKERDDLRANAAKSRVVNKGVFRP
jgi:hypothetical protein